MKDSEREQAVKVLADALLGDPGWSAVSPNEKTRYTILKILCNEAITMAKAVKGETWVAILDDKIAGCFVWNPPGDAAIPVSTYVGGILRALPQVLLHPKVFLRCIQNITAMEAIKPKEDIYYGVFLGCAVQGRGVGSRLVNHLIEKSADTAIYLETQNPVNLKFYDSLGFKARQSLKETFPGGPAAYGLLHGELKPESQVDISTSASLEISASLPEPTHS